MAQRHVINDEMIASLLNEHLDLVPPFWMASFREAPIPATDRGETNAASQSKDAGTDSDAAKTGTTKRPAGIPAAKKSAEIDALWKSLKRRSEKQLKQKKPSTGSSNWNVTYDTPQRHKQRSTVQSSAKGKNDDDSSGDVAIPGVLHVATVAPAKPTSITEASANDQEQDEKTSQKRSRGGVDALLATLQKKKKPTVLDTSKQDWRAYKATHATDAEDLDAHHKSTKQYLDKQEFLTRAALTEHQEEIRRKQKQRSN